MARQPAASLLGTLSTILSMTKFLTFWRSFNLFSTLDDLSLQLRQTYVGSPSSFVTATRNIRPRRLGRSSSSPRIVNNPLACLASTLEIQKRHSIVVAIACCQLCSTLVPVVYLPNISPCYYLQAQLTCHGKFHGNYCLCMRKQCVLGTPSDFLSIWEWGYMHTCKFCIRNFGLVLHVTIA